MKLSKFGEKFSGQSGIVELMDDLGTALNENPEMIFMGAVIPGVFRKLSRYLRRA